MYTHSLGPVVQRPDGLIQSDFVPKFVRKGRVFRDRRRDSRLQEIHIGTGRDLELLESNARRFHASEKILMSFVENAAMLGPIRRSRGLRYQNTLNFCTSTSRGGRGGVDMSKYAKLSVVSPIIQCCLHGHVPQLPSLTRFVNNCLFLLSTSELNERPTIGSDGHVFMFGFCDGHACTKTPNQRQDPRCKARVLGASSDSLREYYSFFLSGRCGYVIPAV